MGIYFLAIGLKVNKDWLLELFNEVFPVFSIQDLFFTGLLYMGEVYGLQEVKFSLSRKKYREVMKQHF